MRTLLALLAMSSSSAYATDVGISDLPCPIGEGSVRIYTKLSSNRLGGWDSDLATYAVGGQWRTYAISTCKENLFSFPSDAGPSPKVKDSAYVAKVNTVLDKARKEMGEDLEIWQRYEVAIRIIELEKDTDPLRIARLYLSAAWTARDRAVDVYKGLDGPMMAARLLKQGKDELQKPKLEKSVQKILHHNLARIAHRGGFFQERDHHLAQFEAVGSLSKQELAVLQTFRKMVNDIEPGLLQKAAVYLEKYLSSATDSRTRGWAHYTRADIARRQGNTDKAKQHYQAVLKSEHAEKKLIELAKWFLENR